MACADCGRDPRTAIAEGGAKTLTMVAMRPGLDGQPWEFCAKCWLEGARPEKMGNFTHAADRPLPKKGDKMGKSLVTGEQYVATGEVIVRRDERTSPAKDDVGSFERKKPAAHFDGGVQYVPDEDGYW